MLLKNCTMQKVILITGCSSGLGYELAKSLGEIGYIVYASMRDVHGRNQYRADEIRKFASFNGQTIVPIELDVTCDSSVEAAVNTIVAQVGRIDILINSAQIWEPGILEAFPIEYWHLCFDTNLFGCVRTIRLYCLS